MPPNTVDVAFMFPPSRLSPFMHHLGVAYIQAYLAKHGITSKQVTPELGCTLNDCVDQLIATDAKVIGLTCFDNNFFLVRTIASIMKRRNPKAVVIAGGPTATFSDELLLTNAPDIDLCVRFEGEETTLELVSLNLDGILQDNLEDVAGISFRRDSSIFRTPDRQLFRDKNNKECVLDGLPSPYLEGILNGTESAGILTARGCTHYCTYCNFAAMSKHTIRYHSIDRVVSELHIIQSASKANHNKRSRKRTVSINDDAFTLNPRRAKDICQRIIDEEIKLPLDCLCRADNMDEELIELLRGAGFVEIFFGLESAVPKVLHNIKKINKIEKLEEEEYASEKRFLHNIKEGITFAKHLGMNTAASIILGLPGETLNDGLQTIEFIRDLDLDSYDHNYLTLFSGTELFNTANKYGIKFKLSEFLLPYDTQYAYPVHEIPFWNNSSIKDLYYESAQIILKTFGGGPDIDRIAQNGIVLVTIERLESNFSFDSLSWLSEALAVGGGIVIHGKENDTIDDFKLLLKASYRAGLPSSKFYYLRSSTIPEAELTYEVINKPLHGQLLQWDPRFPLVRLSKCIQFAKENDPTRTQIFPVYCIMDKIDIYFLTKLAEKVAQQVKCGNIGPRVWLDGVFLDGCRWSNSLCPALKLRHIFINKNGEILPCMTGQPLGNLTDNVQDLRNNARKIYAQIREERKCGECPADSRCSKCLFPHPLNQQEYCELQRANLNISGIVTRSNLVNTVDLSH